MIYEFDGADRQKKADAISEKKHILWAPEKIVVFTGADIPPPPPPPEA